MSDVDFYTNGFWTKLSKLIEKMADRAKGKKVLEALETGSRATGKGCTRASKAQVRD